MKRGKKLIGLVVAVILGLSLILIPVASRLSPVQAAVTWRYPVEVTLDSEKYVVDAWVIRNSATDYEMWYTHGKKASSITDLIGDIADLDLDALIGDIADLDLEQFLGDLSDLVDDIGDIEDLLDVLDGISTVIGYATSTNGRTWTKVNSEVLAGSSSAIWNSVGAPCVIKESDTSYKMWYTRAETDLDRDDLIDILDDIAVPATRKAAILDLMDSISTVIGYAESSDGEVWPVEDRIPQVLPVNVIDVWSSVADPCVIKNSDTDYEMWYTRPKTNLTRDDLDDILADIADIDGFGIDGLLDILDGTSTVIGYATSNNGVTWTEKNYQVLPVSSVVGAWYSVANPSVVKNSDTDYEMWYTDVNSNLLRADLHTLASKIKELGITTLWGTLKTDGVAKFIADLIDALDIDTIKNVLSDTSTVIGYATWDGVSDTWTAQATPDLVGSSDSPWSSVAAPSVVKAGDRYEMWYTEGIGELTRQNLLDLVLGTNLPIGYAYYTPSKPSKPSEPPPTVETNLFGIEGSFPISDEGVIEEEIVATSEDENVTVTIEAGTIALDIEGEPLETLEAAVAPSPPEPPEDAYLIGAYDFGPDGATFDPPITLTWSYDPEAVPEGVDLVIAYYDEVNEEWVWVPCEVDTENNIITASVAHFTTFAIIAVPAELPPVVVPPEEEEVPPVEEEEEPEVVITVTPAAFSVSYLSVSQLEVEPGETVTITVFVANTGGESGSYTVVLKIDGVEEAEKSVTVAAGESQDVSFSVTREEAGSYTVAVDELSGSFTVVAPPVTKAISWWVWLIVGLGVVVIGGLLAYFLWWRRRIV